MSTPEVTLTTLMLRDPEHPTVRRLLLRERERVLSALRDLDELLGLPPTVPPKRAKDQDAQRLARS